MQWNSDIKYCVGLLHLNLVINYIIKSRDEAQHRLFLSNKDLDEFIERSEADILTILTHEEWHHFLLKNKNRKQNTSREKMTRCRFPMMTITDPRESKQQIITWITKDSRHKHVNLTASPDEALHVMAGIYLHDTVFFFFFWIHVIIMWQCQCSKDSYYESLEFKLILIGRDLIYTHLIDSATLDIKDWCCLATANN